MKCYTSSSQSLNIPANQNFFFHNEGMLAHPAQLPRLELERDMLETSLASCVTYLQALRKKLARGARRLDSDSYLPRKKKKKIQQSLRDLEMEIKHRERDEQACLNNLQACKANIYIAETVSSPSTTVSSIVSDLESSTLYSYPEESGPMESATAETVEGPCSGIGYVEQTNAAWSLPMTSTSTQFMFNPEAAVFRPLAVYKDHEVQLDQQFA